MPKADRFIHWHGSRGLRDYKVLFRSEDDTHRFLRAFMEGREKADELASMDANRLSQRHLEILEGLRHRVDRAQENGPFAEGY